MATTDADYGQALDNLETALTDALRAARAAAKAARASGLTRTAACLDGYTIGTLEAFLHDENQTGSVPDLRSEE